MIRQARKTIMLLGMCASPFIAGEAIAGEKNYYRGNSWEVLLKTPDSAGERAFCAFRSTSWAGKFAAVEYNLTSLDNIVPALHVTKQGWNLPTGETTNVSIGTQWAGGVKFAAKVINGDELYGELPADDTQEGMFKVTTILGTAITTTKPAPLVISFEGNEPLWVVPIMGYAEAMALSRDFANCLSALRQLGPSLFKSPEASTTSPFAAPPGQNSGTAEQAPANRSVMFEDPPPAPTVSATVLASTWTFEQREEDWGDTCYVEAKQGDMTIGFMGAPGKDFVGFVENGTFKDVVRASWKIDDTSGYISNGHLDDYFGWYSFYELSSDILNDGKKGKELKIVDFDGKTISLSLATAAVPFSQFQLCFAEPAMKTEASNAYPAAKQTSPNHKNCLLEVDGKKAIDGACYWGQHGTDKGSFVMEGNRYFAYINVNGSHASGSWNETPGSTHAHSDLGDIQREGKCWESKKVRLCPGNE